jgi:amino acid permease
MRYLDSAIINKNKHFNEDLKQVQVNTYYYKRYKSENHILYFIMFMCFIIISIALIKKKMPYFDDLSYSIIVGTIMGLSLLYIVYCIYILIHKDAVNYDEHDYKFDSKTTTDISGNSNSECLQFEPIPIKTSIEYLK